MAISQILIFIFCPPAAVVAAPQLVLSRPTTPSLTTQYTLADPTTQRSNELGGRL